MVEQIIILFLISYLVGSLPTGYWFCRFFYNIDITSRGSGNIGATNVSRVLGGVKYFFLIFLIDAAKAYFMLHSAHQVMFYYYPHINIKNYLILFAAGILAGNAYSIFLRLKGGKGIATMIGIVSYLIPFPLLIMFVVNWVLFLVISRQVFIASLGATYLLTIVYGLMAYTPSNMIFFFLLTLCFWLTLRHHNNIVKFFHRR